MNLPIFSGNVPPKLRRGSGLVLLALVGMLGAATVARQGHFIPNALQGGPHMPQLTEAGQVETHPDGTRTFTHGYRHPDNQQTVTQEYDAQGRLTRAQVKWSGFAGRVLDVTATFGPDGKLLKEEGYRAPEMTTPVTDLLKPLPAGTPTQAPVTPTPDTAPVVVPSLAPAVSTSAATPAATPKADAPESGPPAKAVAVAKADEAEDESAEDDIVKGLHTIYGAQPKPKAGAETENN